MGQVMKICKHRVMALAVTAAAFAVIGCDSGTPSKTPDEFAADSALAADLALANRDTLLVDSIGAYREPDAAERDTARDTTAVKRDTAAKPAAVKPSSAKPVTVASSTPPAPKVVQPPPAKVVAPTPAPVSKPAPAVTTPAKAVAAAPKLKGLRACNSPTAENQSECIRVSLASVDARLNRIYRALITEMRLEEKVPPGGKDPPSVERLRVSQRAWLVYRDNECRRLGKGKEGALWAKPRAKCLGQFSERRANELADNFSRLTAH
jgi:uncharacterized protein YecT (DUF1311 family)